jgi:hypothetical protein
MWEAASATARISAPDTIGTRADNGSGHTIHGRPGVEAFVSRLRGWKPEPSRNRDTFGNLNTLRRSMFKKPNAAPALDPKAVDPTSPESFRNKDGRDAPCISGAFVKQTKSSIQTCMPCLCSFGK